MRIGWGHWGSLNSVLRPWECNNNYGVNMEGASESQSVSPLSQLVVGAGSIEEEGGVGGSSRRQVGR